MDNKSESNLEVDDLETIYYPQMRDVHQWLAIFRTFGGILKKNT